MSKNNITYEILYPYLKDSNFLKKIDEENVKEQKVKIILLDWDENPIREIEGFSQSGSISVDGASAMRRTCNLSMILDEENSDLSNITSVGNLFSINKKAVVLIGLKNTLKLDLEYSKYSDYDYLWFPQGIFVLTDISISKTTSGTSFSLNFKDKMCLLNGDCGGVISSATEFHCLDDYNTNGDYVIRMVLIYDIIQKLLTEYGNESLNNIIIEDVDDKIKQVMKWTGTDDLYLVKLAEENYIYTRENLIGNDSSDVQNGEYYFKEGVLYLKQSSGSDTPLTEETSLPLINNTYKKFKSGEDIGFILTDFVFGGELVASAGETVVSVLDKIINVLGNYEYFYDINGNFRFREKKNYLNAKFNPIMANPSGNYYYISDFYQNGNIYDFSDSKIISAISNAPSYTNVKNDYIIWGAKTFNGEKYPIRYHLAIDKKPSEMNTYSNFVGYEDSDGIIKALQVTSLSAADSGSIKFNDDQTAITEGLDKLLDGRYYYFQNIEEELPRVYNSAGKIVPNIKYGLTTITPTDYRTELYCEGVSRECNGENPGNSYYIELKNEWPKIYNIWGTSIGFTKEFKAAPWEADYFLDIIDTDNKIGEISIDNIGKRSKIEESEDYNCLFEPEMPDIGIVRIGDVSVINNKEIETGVLVEEYTTRGYTYSQVNQDVYKDMAQGGNYNSAYEGIKSMLFQHTQYNENISLTTIPIFYLEPNSRISVKDDSTGIYGKYIINSFTVPLDVSGSMTISASRVIDKI